MPYLLLVHTDSDDRAMYADYLRGEGFTVQEVATTDDAGVSHSLSRLRPLSFTACDFGVYLRIRLPQSTPCPRCQNTGLVRFEMIVRGDRAERLFECGACNHSWRVDAPPSTANDDDQPPRQRVKKKIGS